MRRALWLAVAMFGISLNRPATTRQAGGTAQSAWRAASIFPKSGRSFGVGVRSL
jgi:hypothetical protein